MTKVLFILKRREDYGEQHYSSNGLSTGLFNSATFMKDMLNDLGISAELEVAIDNNCIDRLVTKHKPETVIIEALWVVPEKFAILTKLHPKVKWIIRLHSEIPFLAGEGSAMKWIGQYLDYPQLSIGINAPRMLHDIGIYIEAKYGYSYLKRLVYMPNYYPEEYKTKCFDKTKDHLDVACFGAVRPLKNHLIQAIASLNFCESVGKKLYFHINAGRVEMQGGPALHNLIGMFDNLETRGHKLVTHEWTPREEFLKLCATMDIGMQCNFSETFNIVSADLVSEGVPIVTSKEIPWSWNMFNADPTESSDIFWALRKTYSIPQLNASVNQRLLRKYVRNTKKVWYKLFS